MSANVRKLRAESVATAPTEGQVASWYTQGRPDGLGDRLLMFDNTNAASLELLRFRSPLAATSGFEQALLERVQRLAQFEHPAFPAIRAVEHLDDGGGLALVSTHVPGRRLSEMFQSTQPRAGLHPAFVTWLIRQLTAALAALQSEGEDVCHGALGADRVIVSADGHLLIAEHVLGGALQGLRLTPSRLFQEFGLLAPATKLGVSLIDARSDVVQLGITALSVLLGRQITLDGFQHELERLLDEFSTTAGQRSPFLAPPLRVWLERALQRGDYAFRSAAEARDGLRELPETTSPRGFSAIQASPPFRRNQDTTSRGALPAVEPSTKSAEGRPAPAPAARSSVATPSSGAPSSEAAAPTPVPHQQPASELLGAERRVPVPEPVESRSRQFTSVVSPETEEDEDDYPLPPVVVRKRHIGAWLAVAFAAIALIEAGIIRRMMLSSSASEPSAQIPVLIESPHGGDVVMIDGRRAGTTPLTVPVGSEIHSIRVVPAEPPRVAADSPPDGRTEAARARDARAVPPAVPAAPRPRSGGIRLISPVELQVYENDRLLGTSAAGPIMARPGLHEFEVINTELGYRSVQRINVTEGQVVRLTITPPAGRLSINAIPWAQVWIDGRLAGETPLADVPVAAGEHTVIFRHPDFGERRETVTVRSGAETRVSATLRQ